MKTTKKFKLTDNVNEFNGIRVYQIKALRNFGNVTKGDLGGWVEKEENLSQIDDAWIDENAVVFGNAYVFGNALISGAAMIYGHARIYGNALIGGHARIYGDATIYGHARIYGFAYIYGHSLVCGNAEICGNAGVYGKAEICGDAVVKNNEDYIVFKNFWSNKRYFTWTKSNNMWKVGCFYGTGKELIEKTYADSERSGKEYEKIVRYVDSILADE